MQIVIKPSDLYYRYPRKKETRDQPKFAGVPDAAPFDRNDLYEVLPMFEAVMNELGSNDARVLNRMEEVMDREMPGFVTSREDVYRYLVETMRDLLS